MEKQALTQNELCVALGVSKRTVARWTQHGCPHVRVASGTGARPLFDLEEVKKWLRENRLNSVPAWVNKV
ncbi:Helix-turn-helix domain protein [compost metagenome]